MKYNVSILLLYILTIIVVLAVGIYITVYRYHDCRKVGHTTLYCLTGDT